jgi:hypothetical protein
MLRWVAKAWRSPGEGTQYRQGIREGFLEEARSKPKREGKVGICRVTEGIVGLESMFGTENSLCKGSTGDGRKLRRGGSRKPGEANRWKVALAGCLECSRHSSTCFASFFLSPKLIHLAFLFPHYTSEEAEESFQ